MTPEEQQRCRESFEREFLPRGYGMKMLNDWRYLSDDTEFAWRGYQTAWQAQEQRVKGLVEACAILVERCKKVPLRGFKEQRYFLEALQDAEEELAQYHAGQKEGGDACI